MLYRTSALIFLKSALDPRFARVLFSRKCFSGKDLQDSLEAMLVALAMLINKPRK